MHVAAVEPNTRFNEVIPRVRSTAFLYPTLSRYSLRCDFRLLYPPRHYRRTQLRVLNNHALFRSFLRKLYKD